jgi:hypothetical protein
MNPSFGKVCKKKILRLRKKIKKGACIMRDLNLKPEYSSSHALIIGIDHYQHASPLHHATNDAKAVAEVLQRAFSFSVENVKILLDGQATRADILSAYLKYESTADANSRLLVFFAGHGFTKPTAIREIGFLLPYDGRTNDLSTLIRWEDFTLNAELIPSKHMFFVMDACYGGLIFSRAVSAGSVRFLKDMMIRSVRQALTAGKQDEPVADGGGPRLGHSMFTGYLLDGLEGGARAPEGHLTASSLMSYVYKQVSSDIRSIQTPHYGFLSGDGDFVFDAPELKSLAISDTAEKDMLITISSLEIPEMQNISADPFLAAKQYLSDPKSTIQLHDLVVHHGRKVIIETPKECFPVQGVDFTVEEFTKRLQFCENTTKDLRRLISCIAYWGTKVHRATLSKALSRVTDHLESESGLVIWNSLRWYPTILLCYASGIAALANDRFHNLSAIFNTQVQPLRPNSKYDQLALAIGDEIVDIERSNAFRRLPGHEKYHVPRSEYLLKLLQPELDDDLFLGKDYELMFDRFEVFLALVNATVRKKTSNHVWGPVGRFGWKNSRGMERENPLADTIRQAKDQQVEWPPFKAGLFGTDYENFIEAAEEYSQMVGKLGWW